MVNALHLWPWLDGILMNKPTAQFESIKHWFQCDRQVTAIPLDHVLESYHSMHPRAVFVKSLPTNAVLLDVGAGDGGLEVFRRWPAPARPDIRLFAYSLEKGSSFDEWDGYQLGNWDEGPPDFDGRKFDAIYSSHFIEHIKDASSFLRWCASMLTEGGRVYIEWPSANSLSSPAMSELKEIGFKHLTGNFRDDPTHKELPDRIEVVRQLRKNGLVVDAEATIRMPVFEDALLQHYRATDDVVSLQFAYWLRTGWCQFVAAHLPLGYEQPPTGNT